MSRPEFENDIPIDDWMVALDLLVPRRGDFTTREIDRRFKDGPYIEIAHHHDFSDDTVRRFRVTDDVADQLLRDDLVAGKKEWGWTDKRRLRATDWGHERLWAERKQWGLCDSLTSERWLTRVVRVNSSSTAQEKP